MRVLLHMCHRIADGKDYPGKRGLDGVWIGIKPIATLVTTAKLLWTQGFRELASSATGKSCLNRLGVLSQLFTLARMCPTAVF
jgi:hypothetical protein